MADEDEKPRAVKESFDYADWQKVAEIKKQCPRCGPTFNSKTDCEGAPPPLLIRQDWQQVLLLCSVVALLCCWLCCKANLDEAWLRETALFCALLSRAKSLRETRG